MKPALRWSTARRLPFLLAALVAAIALAPSSARAVEPPQLEASMVTLGTWGQFLEARATLTVKPRESIDKMRTLYQRVGAEAHPQGKVRLGLQFADDLETIFSRRVEARTVLEEALAITEGAQRLAEERAYTQTRLAQIAIDNGQYAEAGSLLQGVPTSGLADARIPSLAAILRGELLLARGQRQAGLESLQRARGAAVESANIEGLNRYVLALARDAEASGRSGADIDRIFEAGRQLIGTPTDRLGFRLRGDLYLAEGLARWRRFERSEAVASLRTAEDNYKNSANVRSPILIWLTIGELLRDFGSFDGAENAYSRALNLYEGNEADAPSILAEIEVGQARVNLARGKLSVADDRLRAATNRLGDSTPPRVRGEVLELRGELARSRGQYQRALDAWRAAASVYETARMPFDEIVVRRLLGQLLLTVGNRSAAVASLRRAADRARVIDAPAVRVEVLASLAQASGDRALLAEAASLSASLASRQLQAEVELAAAELALQAVGDRSADYTPARPTNPEQESRDLTVADESAARAIEFAGDRFPRIVAKARLIRSRVALAMADRVAGTSDEANQARAEWRDRSLTHARAAADTARATRDAGLYASVNTQFGLVLQALGQAEPSLEYFIEAAHSLESARQGLVSTENRTALIAQNITVYSNIVDLLMQLDRPAEAFRWSESAKARTFLDQLAESRANIQPAGLDDLLAEERAALRELQTLQQTRIAVLGRTAVDSARLQSIDAAIAAVARRFEEIKERLRAANPAFADLKYPQPATISAVQNQLSAGQVMLAYTLGPRRSWAFAITPDAVETAELPAASVIAQRVAYHRDLMISGTPIALGEGVESAAVLGEMLLRPFAGVLGGQPDVVIAPDGILNYLPFETLLMRRPDRAPSRYSDVRWWLQEVRSVVYAPSASVFATLDRDHSSGARSGGFVAVGDPVYSATGTGEGGTNTRSMASGPALFPQLPNTRREVVSIAEELASTRSTLLLGSRATEARLKQEMAGARFLHLATHGILDETTPAISGLALTDPSVTGDDGASDEDGFLYLAEIFNLRLSAELVVLSACQTGLGRLVTGEGVEGLTRAFLFAGSPRVAVTLWAVDDASTANLMIDFYRRLNAAGASNDGSNRFAPARAMADAKRAMIAEGRFAAPVFWSAFVMVGRADTAE